MGILDFLSKQFVDVIDWVETPGDLAIRYPVRDREIKNGAQLTVREGQVAFFYNEGQMADAFGPGQHTIETATLPLLTALMNWDGKMAASAVIGIAIDDPSLDFALLGIDPSGKIWSLIDNRAAFAEALRNSKDGVPIQDLGNDGYRLQIDLDHLGWSGLLLATGKGPFDPAVLAPPLGNRGADWRDRVATLAGERGWRTEMIWFRSVEAGQK